MTDKEMQVARGNRGAQRRPISRALYILPLLGYPYAVSGWVRRGRNPRTPPGLRGSNGKEALLGAAGKPARMLFQRVGQRIESRKSLSGD